MKEKIEELINAAEIFKEILECKPSYVSALRGAEDCDDSYQEYVEWTWEYSDTKDILVSKLKEVLELC